MKVNVLFFEGFETLDAFGPVEVLGKVSEYELQYFSVEGGIVTSAQGTQIVTKSMDEIESGQILVVPGGRGTRTYVNDTVFLEKLKTTAVNAKYCLTICTGSALLAKTGLLNQKKATSNKYAMDWVMSVNSEVHWQKSARWIADGQYYTSSGVSAGIDMALGFIADQFGRAKADEIAHGIEYLWNSEAENDPFTR